ncbi:MAG: ATP-binding cassette domain-containing protein [Candidatus Eisenbacteria bacterium]|nr:ATP-binding cassette domain-containing protein [Candidatus Eisenbacteria bacterium]
MEAGYRPAEPPLLEVEGLSKSFVSKGLLGKATTVDAVRDVRFSLARGQAIALVGESGSGKSTVAKLLLRLERPDRGQIRLAGRDVLRDEPHGASLGYRRRVQMVFQDPFGSLNPGHDVLHHLARPLLRHRRATPADVRSKAAALLVRVGLEPAQEFLDRRPFELSGGQRQRVAIARALAVEPDVLIADEPTSMLDVSVRVGILNLLAGLKREQGLALVLITHDLASARYLADRILVCHRGRVVEDADTETLLAAPKHPYTRALLAAIEGLEADEKPRPRAAEPTAGGCRFASRCPEVFDLCRTSEPEPRAAGAAMVRCHLYGAAAGSEPVAASAPAQT